jgi:hypothetical protein
MVWKIIIVVVVTVLMLVAATAFWTDMLHPSAELNFPDFEVLALGSHWYHGTVLVIVGIAGLLLWRWLRAQPRKN